MSTPKKQILRLSNLYLDLLNPRFEEQKSQNEALNTMAMDQKDKLLVLLRDILLNGLNPSDIPIVMPDDEKKNGYVVLEGNRRIAALKLLGKPAIISNASLRKKYESLQKKYGHGIIKDIECIIVNTRDEANLWIERKHSGEQNGIGTVQWNSVQKDRFHSIKTGKDSKVIQILDFLKSISEGDEQFAEQIRRVKPTNLERLLSTPDVRTLLGLDFSQGIFASRLKPEEVQKSLMAVITRLSKDDFSVKDIYRREDRLEFIHGIPVEERPDITNKSESRWELKNYKNTKDYSPETDRHKRLDEVVADALIREISKDGNTMEARPTTREFFIPVDFSIAIPNERINRLFYELKQLSHVHFPNVCSVMIRVFLELSVDYYLEFFGLLKGDIISGAMDPRDLKQKTKNVIEDLSRKKYIDQAKARGMRNYFNQDHSSFSIDSLNAYVHNKDFNPIPEALMLSWENTQPFFELLWKAINDNAS